MQAKPSSSSPANGNQNVNNPNTFICTAAANNVDRRIVNAKVEDNADVPIEIDDSDDEDDKQNCGAQAYVGMKIDQIESNESVEPDNRIEPSKHTVIDIDLTTEITNEDDVKHASKIEIVDEMIDLSVAAFDPDEQNEALGEGAAETVCATINDPNQSKALLNVQIQLKRCDDESIRCNDSIFKPKRKVHSKKRRKIYKGRASKPFKCMRCNFACRLKASLKRHQLIHGDSSTKRFKCDQCDYATRRNDDLKRHQQTHDTQKSMGVVRSVDGRYICPKCTEWFTKWKAVLFHLKNWHTNDQHVFNCIHCLHGFKKAADKERHENRCGHRRFQCHLCKKYIAEYYGDMQKHMREHSGVKPFKCVICEKCFSRKCQLQRHLDSKHSRINI